MARFGAFIGLTFVGIFILTMIYLMFVVLPVMLYAENKCLEQGYPKTAITWNLKVYCVGYDGVVHPVIKPLK